MLQCTRCSDNKVLGGFMGEDEAPKPSFCGIVVI